MHELLNMVEKFRLSESNFLLFSSKYYDNPYCMDESEFRDDLKRIKYIKRLLNKYYSEKQELKERLILNHIILLYNSFGPQASTMMIFFKTEKELWPALKTFLMYLNYMPDYIEGIEENIIYSSSISVDLNVAKKLRGIKHA